MGASFTWRPVDNNDKHFGAASPSAVIAALNKAFGHYPWTFTESSLPMLNALAIVNPDFQKFAEIVEANPSGIIVDVGY